MVGCNRHGFDKAAHAAGLEIGFESMMTLVSSEAKPADSGGGVRFQDSDRGRYIGAGSEPQLRNVVFRGLIPK
jgi:hypothetical protein